MNVRVKGKRIEIDGTPRLILSGEVHYFRLPRDDWRDRLEKLKAAGVNTVASYIPWLCHEPVKGTFDLDGSTRDCLDLGAFIDMCHEMGLWFVARPGPFIMAEMKNEGIPFYLYDDYPHLIPMGWDGAPAGPRTLDYLHPDYLQHVRRWYGAVMPILRDRLIGNGGPIIGVQLDNEVGMLSWVSNTPDLTDFVLEDFRAWLGREIGAEALAATYPYADDDWTSTVRSPREAWAGPLMQHLGWYMRDRFARYIATLRAYAEDEGLHDVPFIVNIHGTEAAGGETYPIGISQLYQSYRQADGYLAGSDHYLGNLTAANAPDWYLINAFQEAVNLPDQPLTSMEFEAGEGDYGQSMGARLDPSAADFKLRMAIAQGNRLINYYLFTGGYNYRMDQRLGDGNDRISFTGERHGTGAPVNPEGVPSYSYGRLARVTTMLGDLADSLSSTTEEHDVISIGFVPDYWMTESQYPNSEHMRSVGADLKRVRFGGPGMVLGRALLQLGIRYRAVNIQDDPFDAHSVPVLAFACGRYLSPELQAALVSYVQGGGQLLLHGELPEMTMTGEPCTTLIDALGLVPVTQRWSTHRYHLSLQGDGWAADRPEWRAGWAQTFEPLADGTLLRVYGEDEIAGADVSLGSGRVIAIAAEVPLDATFWRDLFTQLNVTPGLRHDDPALNIWLGSAVSPDGGRFVHAMNFDGFAKRVHLTLDDKPLAGGLTVTLPQRDAVMLPHGVTQHGVMIAWSTAEVMRWAEDEVVFRLTGETDVVEIESDRAIASVDGFRVEQAGTRITLTSRGDERGVVRFEGIS